VLLEKTHYSSMLFTKNIHQHKTASTLLTYGRHYKHLWCS